MSLYSSLQLQDSHSIRLLESISVNAEGTLTCKLVVASLDQAPSFTALSYVWGDSAVRDCILVNGRPFQATTNLATALRHIPRLWQESKLRTGSRRGSSRLLQEPLRVWADAICINQEDVGERSQQVRLMKRLYSEAELVMCWLADGGVLPAPDNRASSSSVHDEPAGAFDKDLIPSTDPDNDRLGDAFQFFELISQNVDAIEDATGQEFDYIPSNDHRLFDWLYQHPELSAPASTTLQDSKCYSSLTYFLSLNIWSRVWILQEFALARHLVLCHKSGSMPLLVLTRAQAWFEKLRDCTVDVPAYVRADMWRFLTSLHWNAMRPYLEARAYDKLDWPAPTDPLGAWPAWEVLFKGGPLGASNPKDHVCGLLGITGIDISVDYSDETSVAAVSREVAAEWLKTWALHGEVIKSQSPVTCELYFLRYAGSRRQCLNAVCQSLSSWAPNFSHRRHPEAKDTSVLLPPLDATADLDLIASRDACRGAYIKSDSLFVSGMIIDSVAEVYWDLGVGDGLIDLLSDLHAQSSRQRHAKNLKRDNILDRPMRILYEILAQRASKPTPLYELLPQRASNPTLEDLQLAWAFIASIIRRNIFGSHWVLGPVYDPNIDVDDPQVINQRDILLSRLGLLSESGPAFAQSLSEAALSPDDPQRESHDIH